MISGNGTKENPYETVKSNKLTVGSIVKLDEDKWYVYEINDTIKLTLANNLDKQYHFDKEKVTYDIESTGSLAEYLNNDYLDSLSYKDLLKETNWNIGSFKEIDLQNFCAQYFNIEKNNRKLIAPY